MHTRLEGRLVAAHVLCTAQDHARLASSCAVFRVAGTTRNALLGNLSSNYLDLWQVLSLSNRGTAITIFINRTSTESFFHYSIYVQVSVLTAASQ